MNRYSIVINGDFNEFYRGLFSSLHGGLVYATQSFPILYEKTNLEIANYFNERDIAIMKKLIAIRRIQPQQAGEVLLSYLEDTVITNVFTPGAKEEELIHLLNELKKLTAFQRACLEIRLFKEGGGNARYKAKK
jgi:hypothetical protein